MNTMYIFRVEDNTIESKFGGFNELPRLALNSVYDSKFAKGCEGKAFNVEL